MKHVDDVRFNPVQKSWDVKLEFLDQFQLRSSSGCKSPSERVFQLLLVPLTLTGHRHALFTFRYLLSTQRNRFLYLAEIIHVALFTLLLAWALIFFFSRRKKKLTFHQTKDRNNQKGIPFQREGNVEPKSVALRRRRRRRLRTVRSQTFRSSVRPSEAESKAEIWEDWRMGRLTETAPRNANSNTLASLAKLPDGGNLLYLENRGSPSGTILKITHPKTSSSSSTSQKQHNKNAPNNRTNGGERISAFNQVTPH